MSWRSLSTAAALVLLVAACGGDVAEPTDPPLPTTVSSTVPTTEATSAPTTTEGVTGSTSSTTTTTELPATTTSTSSPPATTLGAPEPFAVDVSVSDGEVTGPGRVMVPRGANIRLTVTSDEADEVHFHGYDIFANVAPGQPAIMLVQASIPGVFEVELEGAGLELVLIEVA